MKKECICLLRTIVVVDTGVIDTPERPASVVLAAVVRRAVNGPLVPTA